jgi:hypothetical protein
VSAIFHGISETVAQQFINGLRAGAVEGSFRGASHRGREIYRCEQGRSHVLDDDALRLGLIARFVPLGICPEGAPQRFSRSSREGVLVCCGS